MRSRAPEKDAAVLKIISDEVARTDSSNLNTGATISNLKFGVAEGPVIELSDLRSYSFTGYGRDFFPYMVKNGSIHDRHAHDDFSAKKEPDAAATTLTLERNEP